MSGAGVTDQPGGTFGSLLKGTTMRKLSLGKTISLAAAATVGAGALTLALPTAPAQAVGWSGVEPLDLQGSDTQDVQVVHTGEGDAVAAWRQKDGDVFRIRAATAVNGDWRPAAWVTAPGIDTDDPVLAGNENGDVAVAWTQVDNSDDVRLRAARQVGVADWDGSELLTPFNTNVEAAEIGITGDGTVIAATELEVGGVHQVRRTEWVEGELPGQALTVGLDAVDPSLDVNEQGAALLSYTSLSPQQAVRFTRRSNAGTWSATDQVSFDGTGGGLAEAAISDNGFGVVVFVATTNGDQRVESVKVQTNGSTGSPAIVSPADEDASDPDVEINAHGLSLATWERSKNGVAGIGYGTLPQNSGWSANTLTPGVTAPADPRAAISDDGTQAIAYTGSSDHLVVRYRTNPIHIFSTWDSGAGYLSQFGLDVDDQGNAVVGALREGDPDAFVVPEGRFLDTSGPSAKITGPKQKQVLATSFPVSWQTSDTISAVTGATVIARESEWNAAGFTEPQAVLQAASSPANFAGSPGTTYCVAVQTKDAVGNLSPRTKERCTTLPVDDVTLEGGQVWDRQNQQGHYLGTVTRTEKKGAVLTRTGVRAKRIALVVAKAPKGGEVKVSFGKQSLGTFSLEGKGKKKVIPVKTFDKVRTGTVKITVVSPTGRPVAIDGLVVAK